MAILNRKNLPTSGLGEPGAPVAPFLVEPLAASWTIIKGTSDADYLKGTNGNDQIYGYAEDDRIDGSLGNDWINGGAGRDVLNFGGLSISSLTPNSKLTIKMNGSYWGTAIITNAKGKIIASQHIVNIEDIYGIATISSIHNISVIGSNDITGDDQSNKITGGRGNDIIRCGGGTDVVTTSAGTDILDGGSGNDYILFDDLSGPYNPNNPGNKVSDIINWTMSDSGFSLATVTSLVKGKRIVTGAYKISGIENVWVANPQSVIIKGNKYANYIAGSSGNDRLYGGAGDDQLLGAYGSDILDGGAGDDTLIGGDGGRSILTGGSGNDSFSCLSDATITDFTVGDRLMNRNTSVGDTVNQTFAADGHLILSFKTSSFVGISASIDLIGVSKRLTLASDGDGVYYHL
jgi:Ca2+-binding RTX toxin-like protein